MTPESVENNCQYEYMKGSRCLSDGPFFIVSFGDGGVGSTVSCRLHIIDLSPPNTTLTVMPYDSY